MVEPWRVAQIVVDRGPNHAGSRGSGYLIAPGRVLTAAHVVAEASMVRVRLDVGQDSEVDVQAKAWWADPKGHNGTDLAVVMIPEEATARREFEPTRFGRISDCTAVLVVQAFGFPRFKLRGELADMHQPGVFRDFEQVAGHSPVAANRRQGTLAVYLDDPLPRGEDRSPWEGMSGGPVWTAGRIVAVVGEHHPSEGTGRLTARRIDRAYEQLSGLDLGRFVELLGLAPTASELPDVVPVEQGELVRSAYLAQVRDIAPDTLIGRESELADWAEFCAGTDPYAWWQAGPWAGKTALASWFVTHPPAGTDVVSFFITRRLYSQADSGALLDAMIEQLNALGPADGGSPAVAGARTGAWLNLLASAAAQSEERARRLVIVVDGLDEDEAGAVPSQGRPSIASLLPRHPPPGARFIVTSRPDPGLPDDLPIDHPLRACAPRPLPMSWVAKDLASRAKRELGDLLAGDQIAVDVVGLIAGAGGGLTRGDLSALTRAPPYKLDLVLGGTFGRSLHARASTDPRNPQPDPAARVYLFAHETLRTIAEEQLGSELARYQQKVCEWIDSYADAGWPDTTPGYAIRGYPRLLTATADVARLSALARDPRRHALLQRATGSDYAALTEIRTVQSLIVDRSVLDLRALIELAVYRHAISIRNQFIPADLPIVWARLTLFDRAEALARSITNTYVQARVLAGLVTAIVQAGAPDRAEALASTITDPRYEVLALAGLVTAIAQAGDPDRAYGMADRAEALARTITNPYAQAEALTGLVTAIAQAGDPDRAEALASTITDPRYEVLALAGVVTAIAQAGDPDRAYRLADRVEALARTAADPSDHTQAITRLVTAIAQAGDPDRAYRLADRAEALARTITVPYYQSSFQGYALAWVATAIAQAGDPDRAEALASTITNPSAQAEALTGLVTAIAQAGDPDRAEALASTITNPSAQAEALTGVATAITQAGDEDHARRLADHAEVLARTIADPRAQVEALTELITAITQVGDPQRAYRLADRADALARTIADPRGQVEALTELITAMTQAGDQDRACRLADDAEALARTITEPVARARVLAGLVIAIAQAGDDNRAEALACTINDPAIQSQAIVGLATAVAQAGHPRRAYWLALAPPDSGAQVRAIAGVATAVAQAGHPRRAYWLANRAEAYARTMRNTHAEVLALAESVTAIAQAGHRRHAYRLADRVEALACTIRNTQDEVLALGGLATAIAQAGDQDRSWRLADRAEALARAITDPDHHAQALARVATAIAQGGHQDRADALARSIANPDHQARVFIDLAEVAAHTGDFDQAGRLLARVLVMELPQIWWVKAVSHLFPSIIEDSWDVLVGAYMILR